MYNSPVRESRSHDDVMILTIRGSPGTSPRKHPILAVICTGLRSWRCPHGRSSARLSSKLKVDFCLMRRTSPFGLYSSRSTLQSCNLAILQSLNFSRGIRVISISELLAEIIFLYIDTYNVRQNRILQRGRYRRIEKSTRVNWLNATPVLHPRKQERGSSKVHGQAVIGRMYQNTPDTGPLEAEGDIRIVWGEHGVHRTASTFQQTPTRQKSDGV
jgi:hypothetical protein